MCWLYCFMTGCWNWLLEIENYCSDKFKLLSNSTRGLPLGRTFVPTPFNWVWYDITIVNDNPEIFCWDNDSVKLIEFHFCTLEIFQLFLTVGNYTLPLKIIEIFQTIDVKNLHWELVITYQNINSYWENSIKISFWKIGRLIFLT